jgi:hypothetical protein
MNGRRAGWRRFRNDLRRRELMPTNCDGAAKMGTRGIFVMASRTILH